MFITLHHGVFDSLKQHIVSSIRCGEFSNPFEFSAAADICLDYFPLCLIETLLCCISFAFHLLSISGMLHLSERSPAG